MRFILNIDFNFRLLYGARILGVAIGKKSAWAMGVLNKSWIVAAVGIAAFWSITANGQSTPDELSNQITEEIIRAEASEGLARIGHCRLASDYFSALLAVEPSPTQTIQEVTEVFDKQTACSPSVEREDSQELLRFLVLVGIIAGTGILGGLGAAFLSEADETAIGKKRRCILGVIAAFVVPLFLSMAAPGTDENLINKILSPQEPDADRLTNILILAGFCIVAAVSAQRFLQTISARVLALAEKTAESVKGVESQVAEAETRAREAESRSEDVEKKLANLELGEGPNQPLEPDQIELLKAFVAVPDDKPSLNALAGCTGKDPEEARNLLLDLREAGFVWQEPSTTRDPETWGLRGWGKQRLRSESGLEENDLKTLQAMSESTIRRPRSPQLVEPTGLSSEQVRASLTRLKKLGLVAKSKSEPGGWRLRRWGAIAASKHTDA